MKQKTLFILFTLALLTVSCSLSNKQEKAQIAEKKALIATSYFSGFDLAHDTYNAISAASDGKIYYVLSS